MSRRVGGRAFHASGPENENARSPMDVHLGSGYNVLMAERRPGRVGLYLLTYLLTDTFIYSKK